MYHMIGFPGATEIVHYIIFDLTVPSSLQPSVQLGQYRNGD